MVEGELRWEIIIEPKKQQQELSPLIRRGEVKCIGGKK